MKNIFLLILTISSLHSYSKTIISTKSGNWNQIQTWNSLTIPKSSDTVIIANQDTVNINTNSAKCDYLELNGTIFFKSPSNNLTSRVILSKNKSEINGTSLAILRADDFINDGMLSIGKIKLTINKNFINNSKLEFSSISGTKTFGTLINLGIINNPQKETLFIERSLNNQGEINFNSAPLIFTKNAIIQSKNLLNIEKLIFNDSLINSDSISVKSINGRTLINKGHLNFTGKESDISINNLKSIIPSTITFSHKGNVSFPNFTNINFHNLSINCKRFLTNQQLTGSGKLSVSGNTTLTIKAENIFPLFTNYNFHSFSNIIFEKNTLLPKNIQFGNVEVKSKFNLDLINTDSLFISGNLIGAGKIKNHKNIIYNGTEKQKIKRMDYAKLIYKNSSADTSSILGTCLIDSILIINGKILLGGLTINNSEVKKNGTLIIGSSNPTFKRNLIIEGLVTLNQNQSSPVFNNIVILPSGTFKNNASSNPIITGNITNNGKFIGCNGTACDYNFKNNNAYIKGTDTVFISKIKAKKITNSGLLFVSQSLKVDSMIADSNAQLWLQMDSIHISGNFDFHSTKNTVVFNKKNLQNISKKMTRFHHLIIENKGKKVLHNNIYINKKLDIYVNSILKTDSFNTIFSNNAKLNIRKSGHLILGHNYFSSPILFPSSLKRKNINLHDSSFVHYAGKKNQTISCLPKYGNLIIDDGAVDSSFISLDNDTLYVNGNLNLKESSINFQILDKVIKVKGDWNGPGNCKLTSGLFYLGGNGNSSGKITPGASTFIYNGKSKQRFKISKYNNVIIDKIGEAYTKANIGKLYIDSLFVKNGIMNFKGEASYVKVLTIKDSVIFGSALQEKIFNTINICSTGLFELDYNEIVTVTGDINCNGNLTIKKGTLLFTDTFPQNIIGNGFITLGKTKINKHKNHLSIYTDLKLIDTLQMDSGKIFLNDACFNLEGKSFIKNENENAYFSGNNKGQIKTSKFIQANESNDFHGIGVNISNQSPMGNTIITRKFNSINIAGKPSALSNFDILPTFNSSINANLKINFFKSDLNNLDSNNLALWKSEDNIKWIKMNGIVNQNQISLANVSSFSKWTINRKKINVLSVVLISYSVKREDETIKINWKIADEINTIGYLIELSHDGVNFQKKEILKSNNIKSYNCDLVNKSNNITYIRVSEITKDKSSILFTKPVKPYDKIKPKIRVVNNKIFIDDFNDGMVKIFSSNGQLLENIFAQEKIKTIFSKGVYFILLTNKIETTTFKVGIK